MKQKQLLASGALIATLSLSGCGGGGGGTSLPFTPTTTGSPTTAVQTHPVPASITFDGSAPDPKLNGLKAQPQNTTNGLQLSPPATNASFIDGDGLLTASGLQHAYGVDTLLASGQVPASAQGKQIVAIVDAFGNNTHSTVGDPYGTSQINADLVTYANSNGLPAPSITYAVENGRNTSNSSSQDVSGWEMETALDVDMVHAAAPNAQILLVLTRTDNFSDLLDGVDFAANFADGSNNPVTAVSMSFAGVENPFFDFHFHRTNVTFIAASGDSGSSGPEGNPSVGWPASCPAVLAAGGTVLTYSGSTPSETGWNGSGGGVSAVEPAPAYQAFTGNSFREVPDVASNAGSGIDVVLNGAEVGVGGTSAASPFWAGLIALANCQSTTGAIDHAIKDIYSLAVPAPGDFSQAPTANEGSYTTDFNDIGPGVSNGLFSTATGYDEVTGLGSPKANTLMTALSAGP